MKQYTISEAALQQVLNYLASRPYVEVFEIVKAVQSSAAPVTDSAPEQAPVQAATGTDAAAPSQNN